MILRCIASRLSLLRGCTTTRRAPTSVLRSAGKQMSTMVDHEVLSSVEGGVGLITLNRPKALNSLNMNMVTQLRVLLSRWSAPASGVDCVVIRGAGDKAFCAGGDVKTCVLEAEAGNHEGPIEFFAQEYRANAEIASLPLPYVALLDGIVMGGGAGVSIHGHFRVATERSVFAMPECAIGLYPDIGASFFLNQLPGRLGMYLALTGARLQGSTLLEAGLATHYLPSACVHTLPARLVASLAAKPGSHRRELGTVAGVLSAAQAEAGTPPPGQLSRLLPLLDQHFVYDTVPEIMASLESAASKASGENTFADAFVRDALEAMKRGSPLSQAITLKLMRRAAHAPLRTCLAVDTLLVSKFVRGDGDFIQGVRSVLIDRGTKPAWKYATSEQVPSAAVEHFFADTPFASVQACSPPQATSKL